MSCIQISNISALSRNKTASGELHYNPNSRRPLISCNPIHVSDMGYGSENEHQTRKTAPVTLDGAPRCRTGPSAFPKRG
jgi:hypothetical protein